MQWRLENWMVHREKLRLAGERPGGHCWRLSCGSSWVQHIGYTGTARYPPRTGTHVNRSCIEPSREVHARDGWERAALFLGPPKIMSLQCHIVNCLPFCSLVLSDLIIIMPWIFALRIRNCNLFWVYRGP